VPLIVVDPGATGNGTACDKPVELLHLYPTVADWAGLKRPAQLDGVSLRSLLDDPANARWDRMAYSQVTRGRGKQRIMGYSVHTGRYRYTEWDEGRAGVELYDHQSDPGELHNLADAPAHQSTRDGLRALLRPHIEAGARAPTAPAKPAPTRE
jgi:uncharacterized sulfatase